MRQEAVLMFLKTLQFALFSWLKIDLTQPRFSHLDRGLIDQLLQLSEQLGQVAMAPISHVLDRQAPQIVDGKVQTPAVLKDTLAALAQSEVFATPAPLAEGGTALPYVIHTAVAALLNQFDEARIAVGVGAAAMGWRGYELALEYAKTSTQGSQLGHADASTPQIPIIEHMDVRRMLLQARAQSEGALALCLYAANLSDQAHGDANAAKLLGLLTPMVKSWPAKYALEANDLAIQVLTWQHVQYQQVLTWQHVEHQQVLGGAGYTQDYLLEKLYRDNRLNPIHEGTHGIQALDLLARKVIADDGAALVLLLTRIAVTAQTAAKIPAIAQYAPSALELGTQLAQAALKLGAQLKTGQAQAALANAGVFLDALGTVVVCWLSLDQAVAAQGAPEWVKVLANCRYLHHYELNKVQAAVAVFHAPEILSGACGF